jgi:hypothetical protein
LRKDPRVRASIAETERLLRRAVSDAGPVDPESTGGAGTVSWEQPRAPRRRRTLVVAAVTVVSMLAALVTVLVASGSGGRDTAARTLADVSVPGAAAPATSDLPGGPTGGAASPSPAGVTNRVGHGPAVSPSPPPPTHPATQPGLRRRDAYGTIQAESYDQQSGVRLEATSDAGGGQDITSIGTGDWVLYRSVDFGTVVATQFVARIAGGAPVGVGGLVEVRLDSLGNAPIGSAATSSTGGWQSWLTVPTNISGVTGVHDVYVTFSSAQTANWISVNWLTFGH